MPTQQTSSNSSAGPSAFWLASGFILAGLGTVVLGPILPALSRNWQLTDAQGGILLAAKFLGGFLGGVTVLPRLRIAILAGCALCFAGFGAFALSTSLWTAAPALLLGGLGLGQMIAATNILVGRRFREHTGSALSSLNAFWSLGAVATGLLAALLLPRFALRGPLLSFAALFLAVGLGGLLNTSHTAQPSATIDAPNAPSLPRRILLKFAFFLFLYGGLETCLAGWLTTYTLRFSDARLLGGQSALVLLWIALTAGRALSAAALRYVTEVAIQRIGLLCAAIFIASLAFAHHMAGLSLVCILLGLSLAPFFPSTFALLIKHGPSAREAGFILAVSGLGAALFPWMMGVISTRSGSLRIAMAVPLALAVALLLLSLYRTPVIHSASEAAANIGV
jgi:FHS family glucose/mannose:H+ symporter-like MFS transporter